MVVALKSALRFANFEAKKVLQPNPEVLSYFMAKILQKRLRIVCNFFTGGKPNSPFCLFGQMGAPQNLVNKFDFVRQAVRCLGSPRVGELLPSTPLLLSVCNLAFQSVDEVADRLALLPHLRTDFSEYRNEVWENLLRLQEHFFV